MIFLLIFLNLLSFASFGFEYTENGVKYDFKIDIATNTGTLTISKDEGVSDDKMPEREISADGVNKTIGRPDVDTQDNTVTTIIIKDGVTSIGDDAFRNCSALTSMTIPDGVTNIGNYAFRNCSALESITIPNSVTSIGDLAFYNCSALSSITIPEGVPSISFCAFYGCSALTSVTIPNSVASIDDWAFTDCTALTSIIMPSNVGSIGMFAFYNCGNLKDVYYIGTKEQWKKITKNNGNDQLTSATVHFNCNILTVKKVWKDNDDSRLKRSKPQSVLYRVYTGCTKSGESGQYTCSNQTVTVDRENGDYVKKEGKATYTVYKKMRIGTGEDDEYTQGNFQYDLDGIYQDVKFKNDDGKVVVEEDGGAEKDVWLCKFIIFNHVADNKYAVSEDPMVGYTSSAPTP